MKTSMGVLCVIAMSMVLTSCYTRSCNNAMVEQQKVTTTETVENTETKSAA